MSRTKILMYALFDKDNIQAQSRDAINWAINLDDHLYHISGFSKNLVDNRILNSKHISTIKVSKNKYLRHLRMTLALFNPRFDYILLSMPSINISIYLLIIKHISLLRKRIIISLVNRLPYPEWHANIMYSNQFQQFAISSKIQDDFSKITERTIPIVHLAYDKVLFQSNLERTPDNKILCVGSMQLRKNPFLFSSLARANPDFNFVWIGDGYYFSWIEDRIKENGLTNLTLIRRMTQESLAAYMNQCSIFILPSVHEGFPNVIVEALAAGLPVITLNTYGPEAVIDGYNGYVAIDELDINDKLIELMSNHELFVRMSENAPKSVEKYFGPKGVTEFHELIENMSS
jgi:glycosyltransferase involved in cell wall biosynthesis